VRFKHAIEESDLIPDTRSRGLFAETYTDYTAKLPVGAGDVHYYIEAEDGKGNVSRGALERVYLA
jgi:hypothetical protein